MRSWIRLGIPFLLLTGLAACGGGGGSGTGLRGGGLPAAEGAVKVPVQATRDGTSYRQEVPVAATGDTMVIQVFEPARLEKGRSYPLVLHSHGYGGTRSTTPSAFQQRLLDAGYYVISIDERGAGESSGTVRVMDPDFEGQNLIAVLDWAEDLEGLRRRSNGQMMVGSYGGSYGGMYQLLLYAADPKHRLRVLAPDITPHDLTYALNPNNTVKSGWALALSAGGEGLGGLFSLAGGGLPDPLALINSLLSPVTRPGLRQDATIYETLITGALTNQFPETGFNYFKYHSFSYFCDGEPAGPQSFLIGSPDPILFAPVKPPAADVLLTQGFRDTLFNFNDGLGNYECLKSLGGDVRLLTHQSGHILPVSLGTVGLEDPLDPFYLALTFPGFQDGGGTRSCGSMDLDEVQFGWFEEKLRGKTGSVNAALKTGGNVCLSLAEGDAIAVSRVKRGGEEFAINSSTPQLNSALGIAGSVLGNAAREALLATQPLTTLPAGGGVIAGVPLLDVTLSGLSGAEMAECALPVSLAACDPILFLAIGHRHAGQQRWDIIDDQLTPVRGFGQHSLEMTGIAERLAEGDELALLVFGFHAQYPVTWSRDLLVPALSLSGTLQLPLLQRSEIARDGV